MALITTLSSSKNNSREAGRPWSTLLMAIVAISMTCIVLLRDNQDSLTFVDLSAITTATTPTSSMQSTKSESHLDGLQTPTMRDQMMASCPERLRLKADVTMEQTDFIDIIFRGLRQTLVKADPLYYVADNFGNYVKDRGALSDGFWAEFGVFKGKSLAQQREKTRDSFHGVMAGFDSFKGLPEDWRSGEGQRGFTFSRGSFSSPYKVARENIPDDVKLYKGWFQDSIGKFLADHPGLPASFIHHDGDLFISTTITFQLLSDRIVPGTVMCFDELFGYPGFKDHEILALFLWMKQVDATLCPLAQMEGPPAHATSLKDNNMVKQARAPFQAACFQVLDLKN